MMSHPTVLDLEITAHRYVDLHPRAALPEKGSLSLDPGGMVASCLRKLARRVLQRLAASALVRPTAPCNPLDAS